MADMHIMFGRAYDNEVEARRLYQDASPGYRIQTEQDCKCVLFGVGLH
jgi:hypothetical protein